MISRIQSISSFKSPKRLEGKKASASKKALPKKMGNRIASLLSKMLCGDGGGQEPRDQAFYFRRFLLHKSPKAARRYARRIHGLAIEVFDHEEESAQELDYMAQNLDAALKWHKHSSFQEINKLREEIKMHLSQMDDIYLPSCVDRTYPYVFLGRELISLRTLSRKRFAHFIDLYDSLRQNYGLWVQNFPSSGIRFVSMVLKQELFAKDR